MPQLIRSMIRAIMIGSVVAFIFVIMAFIIPTEPWRAVYQAVNPEGLQLGQETTSSKEFYWVTGTFPKFVITNDHLYLVEQYSSCSLMDVIFCSAEWNAEKIQAFRKAHPELEPQWPHAEQPDGGVAWIRRRAN